MATILAVGELGSDLLALRQVLEVEGPTWKLAEASGCREALAFLPGEEVFIVISAQAFPDGDWRSLLEGIADLPNLPNPPRLVVCSRPPDDRLWAEVLNLGGYDVLLSPLRPSEVKQVALKAWRSWKYGR